MISSFDTDIARNVSLNILKYSAIYLNAYWHYTEQEKKRRGERTILTRA